MKRPLKATDDVTIKRLRNLDKTLYLLFSKGCSHQICTKRLVKDAS